MVRLACILGWVMEAFEHRGLGRWGAGVAGST